MQPYLATNLIAGVNPTSYSIYADAIKPSVNELKRLEAYKYGNFLSLRQLCFKLFWSPNNSCSVARYLRSSADNITTLLLFLGVLTSAIRTNLWIKIAILYFLTIQQRKINKYAGDNNSKFTAATYAMWKYICWQRCNELKNLTPADIINQKSIFLDGRKCQLNIHWIFLVT